MSWVDAWAFSMICTSYPSAVPGETGSLLGRKLLEHVPEFAVELVRLFQHRVVADAFDGDCTKVGVLLVGLGGRGGEELVPAGGVDPPHRHLGLLQPFPRFEAEEVAREAEPHLPVLAFRLLLSP